MTEQVATANQILTNVRQLREKLVIESTEASQSLSQALLDIVVYAERVDNVGHLLSLADSCIGQIRSRMRAHGIPIHIPSTPSNAVIVPDVGPAVQGEFLFDVCMTLYLPNHQTSLPKPHDLLHMYRRNHAYLMFESTRI